MKNVFLRLLVSLSLLNIVLFANTAKEYLSVFNGLKSQKIVTMNAQTSITVPIPDRWRVKSVLLHIEYVPSKALVSQRSVLSLYFNGVVLYQQKLNLKGIDRYTADIKIPVELISDYNNIKIIASQHYCMNCCEKEDSPELWTEIFWKNSYIKVDYEEKKIKSNLSYLKSFVLDDKQFNPLKFGILLQNKNDFFVTLGGEVAGFLGKIIKYRKIYVNSVDNIFYNEDIFVIGTKDFVKRILKIDNDLANIFVLPNPLFPTKSIVVLTADDEKELKKVVDTFISIKKSTLLGKNLNVENFKQPLIKAYESPRIMPLDKKISLYDLGYNDLKFYHPSYSYDVFFNISPDIYLYSKRDMVFHLAYNYGEGARKDSIINIFLNGKFLTQIKANKDYGTILEEKDLKIPVYMLAPGKNKITIQYGLMPTGKGFCVAPNFYELQGTVFAKKTYIKLPNLPHWREMPYIELFTTSAYPFSIYPDLKDTQIFLSSKSKNLLSSFYTLMAYMGGKIWVPFYSLSVVSDVENLNRNKNIIAIGNSFPKDFYNNLPIKISEDNVVLKYSIFHKIKNIIKSKVLGLKEKEDLKVILSMKDNLENETIFTEGESPYKSNKTVFLITSNSYKDIYQNIKSLYIPKFASKIKGDFVVVDNLTNKVYHANLAKKYYVGHLPLFEYLVYKLGFSFEWLLVYSLIVIMILIVIIKLLLDFREKRIKK